MATFLDALRSGRVLLMDGAMGTQLQHAGIQAGECYEQWNLTHPQRILAIHRAYVDAGARVLLTNTFQANSVALGKHGLNGQLGTICQQGLSLAREAAGPDRFILMDVGPWAGLDEALVQLVRKCPSDGALLETLNDPLPALAMMEHDAEPAADRDERPLLVSCTYCHHPGRGIRTIKGLAPEAVARRAARHGAHALGVNCGRDISIDDCVEILRRYRTVTDLPLFARPNAGTPTLVDGRWVYPHSPGQMAERLPDLLNAGVAMVGGCCGTTPEHIAAFRDRLSAYDRASR